MAEVIDDTATFTVSAQLQAKARIANLVAPTEVLIGECFSVEYDVYNDGDVEGSMLGRIMNINDPANPILITGSDWTETIQPDGHKHVTFEFTDGITEDLNAKVEAGHNE